MVWNYLETYTPITNSWTGFIVWILTSIIFIMVFLLVHRWWINKPTNKKYLKIKKEEGILVFIKRNIFLMLAFIFLISLISAIFTLINWLR